MNYTDDTLDDDISELDIRLDQTIKYLARRCAVEEQAWFVQALGDALDGLGVMVTGHPDPVARVDQLGERFAHEVLRWFKKKPELRREVIDSALDVIRRLARDLHLIGELEREDAARRSTGPEAGSGSPRRSTTARRSAPASR